MSRIWTQRGQRAKALIYRNMKGNDQNKVKSRIFGRAEKEQM